MRLLETIVRGLRDVLTRLLPAPGWEELNARRVARLRALGARVGKDCVVLTDAVPTEPYLLELGDNAGVAGGTIFATHDGSVRLARGGRPHLQCLGRVIVGANSFVGQNCILLPGTDIGRDCIVAAGSVVRGRVPDNSVVAGNPARVVGRASLATSMALASPNALDTLDLPEAERRRVIEAHFGLTPAAASGPSPS